MQMLASEAALPYRIIWAAFSSGGDLRFPSGLVKCGLNTGVGTCEVPEHAASEGLPVRPGQFRDPASPGPSDLNPINHNHTFLFAKLTYNTNITIGSRVALSNLGGF